MTFVVRRGRVAGRGKEAIGPGGTVGEERLQGVLIRGRLVEQQRFEPKQRVPLCLLSD